MIDTVIDFHTHVLPRIDDGSRDANETHAMLDEIARQGVCTIVATPHFYPYRDRTDAFLTRRERAVEGLLSVYDRNSHPQICLGAEVAFFHGISHSDSLRRLCIVGTRYILIEMMFSKWTDDAVAELIQIREELDLCPIVAHIERFLKYIKRGTIERLAQHGILIQSNAEFFLDGDTRKRALRMLAKGQIDLLGSDCHNMKLRKPNLSDAVDVISERFGDAMIRNIAGLSEDVLERAVRI